MKALTSFKEDNVYEFGEVQWPSGKEHTSQSEGRRFEPRWGSVCCILEQGALFPVALLNLGVI